MKQPEAIPIAGAASSPKPLEHAPQRPISSWRYFRLFRACTLVAIFLALAWWGRAACMLAIRLKHERACERYDAPPDQVVFDSDPARAAALANDPSFLISDGCAFRRPPSDWQARAATLAVPGVPRALLFLHERHAAGGDHHIVAVDGFGEPGVRTCFRVAHGVESCVLEPSEMMRPMGLVFPWPFAQTLWRYTGDSRPDIRVYAGQPDPTDASHFTIRYESGGVMHTLDSYLAADGSLTMKWPDVPLRVPK